MAGITNVGLQQHLLSQLLTTNRAASQIAAPASSESSFDCFARLPQELLSQIIALACSLPSFSADGGPPALDVTTARSLALTSRHFHAQATPLLWGTIRITRPSALSRFCTAIRARPKLARLITSLHVGPEEEASQANEPDWRQGAVVPTGGVWQPPITMMTASLRHAGKVKLEPVAPSKILLEREWQLKVTYDSACLSAAVSDALLSIQRVLNVDLTGRDRWLQRSIPRLYEAQAAVEMYLIDTELRSRNARLRLDQDRKSWFHFTGCNRHVVCPQYPPLELVQKSARQSGPIYGQAVLRLSRQDLHNWMNRPGSSHDRFDHPALLARSRINPELIIVSAEERTRWQPDSPHGPEGIFGEWSNAAVEGWTWRRNAASIDTRSLDEVEPMIRWLLGQLTNLQNLSLSSYFGGGYYLHAQPSLVRWQSLTLGPLPRLKIHLDCPWFSELPREVKSVHICGFIPLAQDVALLGLLPALLELRFTLSDELTDKELLYLGVFLDALVGRTGAAATHSAHEAASRVDNNTEESDGFKQVANLRDLMSKQAKQRCLAEREEAAKLTVSSEPLVAVRLRPAALAAVLGRATCDEEREAWATCRPLRGQARRLLLVELPAAKSMTSHGTLQHPLYEESRKWWEEHRAQRPCPYERGEEDSNFPAENVAEVQSEKQMCVCS